MSHENANRPLPQGFHLDGYRIERQLSMGGFSIVYLARDEAGTPVAIKEYLPFQLARRTGDDPVPTVDPEHRPAFNQGMKSFVEEARLLAHIDHPNVVRVLNFLRANETAYMVMRYESGCSLKEHIHQLKAHGAAIQESVLRQIFVHLLNGLREVHRQTLLHLDIKPANIFITDDDKAVLIDFGAAREVLNTEGNFVRPMYTPGFAAPEMYKRNSAMGPWTDIYAVGACIYACMQGYPPHDAPQRIEKDRLSTAMTRLRGLYSDSLIEVVQWCMATDPLARPQSVFALQKELNREEERHYTEPGLAEKLRMRLGSLMGKADDASAPRPRSSFHDT